MELNFPERRALARLLARRLPRYAQRASVASEAGVAGASQLTGDALVSWSDIVERAERADTIPALLRSASSLLPGDARLGRAAAAAGEGRLALGGYPLGLSPRWLAAAALGLVLGGVWLGLRSLGRDTVADPEIVAEGAAGAAASDAAAEDAAASDAEALMEAAETPDPAAQAPTGEPSTADAPTGDPPTVDTPTGDPSAAQPPAAIAGAPLSRCPPGPGGISGFWYTTLALSPGTVHTLTHGVNVRSDYPRLENGWSSSAPVVCVLQPGDRVKISGAPIDVGRGYRWVPLSGGDLLTGSGH